MADYASLAITTLVGRICQGIKEKLSGKGTKMAWFSIVTDSYYYGDTGPRPNYHRVVCFGKRAEFILKYGSIGKRFIIVGEPHTRSWIDKEGNKQSIHELIAERVIALDPFDKGSPKKQSETKAKGKNPVDEKDDHPSDASDRPIEEKEGHV